MGGGKGAGEGIDRFTISDFLFAHIRVLHKETYFSCFLGNR